MIHRLNLILKKCSDKEFRKGFVKYIESLDYKEFEALFIHYTTIIATLMIRYSAKTIKKYSVDWFKQKAINRKYDQLYNLFADANFLFVVQFNKNIGDRNLKREEILQKIEDIKKFISVAFNKDVILNIPLLQNDKIKIIIMLTNSAYAEKELKRLMEELNKTK